MSRARLAPPLRATYRLQLHADFPLRAVRALAAYLDRLGVSHVYSSPLLQARPGSTHGYDVVDPRALNPELGTAAELRALAATLHRRAMGLMLDIVPNHMGVGAANPAWDDLLRRGRRSRFAPWFDVDWDADAAAGGRRPHVVLPVLGVPLADALARGEIALVARGATLRVRYFDHDFPLDPATLPPALRRPGSARRAALAAFRGPAGAARLRALLDRQAYRLVWWREAAARINYRRFFDINELAAVRQEDPRVFAARHARLAVWVRAGVVDALRVDHVDGLYDPGEYLRRLQRRVATRAGGERLPIYVEKILAPDEELPRSWPVAGATGYGFLNELEGIFIDADGYTALERWYRRTILPGAPDFRAVADAAKEAVLEGALAPDVGRVCRAVLPPARRDRVLRRLAPARLRAAVIELMVCLPVYRTYLDGRRAARAADRAALAAAVAHGRVRRRVPAAHLRALSALMLADGRGRASAARRAFVARFQQTSGPAAAKGVEDTALYAYGPLLSRNEVGGDPFEDLTDAVARLHHANGRRASAWPHALLATSTHDTKRSADVRARLDVLSEIPATWTGLIERWRRRHRHLRRRLRRGPAPDAHTEYVLYQTLVGVWPVGARGGSRRALRARVEAYMTKAMREAKTRTSWRAPDAAFEGAVVDFLRALVPERGATVFTRELDRLTARVGRAGLWTALSRTLVHLTAPGVPDLYQGDELWTFTLVDPDNRRPVDYERRRRLLDDVVRAAGRGAERRRALARWLRRPEDGRVKLHVVHAALQARRRSPTVFAGGEYVPLAVEGARARHVFAFARRADERVAVVIVPRLLGSLQGRGGAAPLGRTVWRDTVVVLPPELAVASLTDVLSGVRVEVDGGAGGRTVALAGALGRGPVALLVGVSAARAPRRRRSTRTRANGIPTP